MTDKNNLHRLTAPFCLEGATASRLSELAVEWDVTLHDALQAAIHVAYLQMLENKLAVAANALQAIHAQRLTDDELPF